MEKKISIQCSSSRISSRRIVLVYVVVLLVSQSISYAEIQYGSFDFDGRLRNYMVYLPNNYNGSVKFPLVIHLHSGSWTAQQDMDYIKLNQVAETSGFIVAYPSAINKRWNIDSVPGSNINDVGFIDAVIDTLNNRYSIDPERIYACGYSLGGAMAYSLALQLSHRIAAIASVAGFISNFTAESYSPVRPVPILHIHGTSDAWVPINGSSSRLSVDQTLSIWINSNECFQTETTALPDLDTTDGCTVEKTTYTDCSDNCDIVYYKVINGGHTWPGAGPPGYAAGKTTQDFNASVEIWNFFKNYKLAVSPVVDFNGDGIVDIKDLLRLIQSWGRDDPMVDIAPSSGDGVVDALDLEVLMSYWEQEVEDPTLVAHWALDEMEGMFVTDSAGDNDGYAVGDPVWQPEGGQVDGAIQLDGVDDYVITATAPNPQKRVLSTIVWIKGGAPGQVILSQMGGANWLCTDPSAGTLMTSLTIVGRNGCSLESQAVITDGNWHRVGFVWDGSFRTLYVDGILVAEDEQDNLEISSNGLQIGTGGLMQPGTYFSGLIDDIRIYNRVIIP